MSRKQYTKISYVDFVRIMGDHFIPGRELSRKEIISVCQKELISPPDSIWEACKIRRGVYVIAADLKVSNDPVKPRATVSKESVGVISKPIEVAPEAVENTAPNRGVVSVNTAEVSFVPNEDPAYVPHGVHRDIVKILKANTFFPAFITGMSGNGKTLGIEQACAKLKREFLRVNFTAETDEDDLMGGFRLIEGETVFQYGPVVEAMLRGAVLLLDEIDLGVPGKIMCLQSVLEGKGYFVKKLGKWITPASGFMVFTTANTKGQGSDSGKFIGTNVLNEAFLDRFAITLEQEYPSMGVEEKILNKFADVHGLNMEVIEPFTADLVKWSAIIRSTYDEGGVSEIISTRRLIHAITNYSIFNDKSKAIEGTVARFDQETKDSFLELFNTLHVMDDTSPQVPDLGELVDIV